VKLLLGKEPFLAKLHALAVRFLGPMAISWVRTDFQQLPRERLTMEKALKYERQMKWAMICVIVICAAILVLGILWDTAGATQISGPVACFTTAIYALGRRAIEELKSEVKRLQTGGSEE
jgi:CobQ-like glutamine amidotransferase family enzyme